MQNVPVETDAGGFYHARSKLFVPFEVIGGRLVIAVSAKPGEPIGDPIEAWEHLFLEQGAKRSRIGRLDQLQGKVRITSPESALAFVRLTTTLATCFLFPVSNHSRVLDVIDGSKLDSYNLYGDHKSWFKDATYSDGFGGVLRHKKYRELKIPDTVSRRVFGGFLVERPVVF